MRTFVFLNKMHFANGDMKKWFLAFWRSSFEKRESDNYSRVHRTISDTVFLVLKLSHLY